MTSPTWTSITDDAKTLVVDFLDYSSRCNMRLCSKNDRILVDSTTFKAEKLSISEWPSDMTANKTLIRIDIDSFTVWFIGKENVTRVDRAWNDELVTEYSEVKQENRHDLIRQFLEKYQRKYGIIEAGTINLVTFEHPPSPNLKIKCSNLIFYEIGDHHTTWLNQCTSRKFKKLEISRSTGPVTPIDERILRTSESLRLNLNSEMTDNELAMLKTADLHIRSDQITADGVRRFIEHFLKTGQKGEDMEITIPLSRDYDFRRLIPTTTQFHKTKIPEWSSSCFRAILTGGFNNNHGINDSRVLRVRFTPGQAEITCEIPKKTESQCELYPFTSH